MALRFIIFNARGVHVGWIFLKIFVYFPRVLELYFTVYVNRCDAVGGGLICFFLVIFTAICRFVFAKILIQINTLVSQRQI